MRPTRWTRRRLGIVAGSVVLVIAALGVAAFALAGSADVVVYNGRSQYGDEQAFKAFEEQTGLDVELRGGTAPELYERLRREGEDTDADLLVTTDLANLWRADEADLLEPVELDSNVELHAADGAWWGISTRLRVPMRSTERVEEDAITGYEDLANPDFRGRVCLRTSNNEYNQSWVADRIAKFGEPETEELLESIMANEPRILGSDVDVLEAIAAGDCDVGLTNHYYLARELKDEPRLPGGARLARGRGPHQRVGRRPRQGRRRAARERDPPDGVPHRPRGAGGDRGERRVRGQPRRAAGRAHQRLGGGRDRPDRRRAGGPVARRRRRADAARGVEVARSGWTVAGVAVAALIVAPLLVLPASFLGEGEALDSIAADLLPDALRASLVLAAGVGLGTLLLGGALAALVSFYDFPGRRWLDWALVLPMAMPAYVLVFVLLGQYDDAALGLRLPELRSTAGTIAVLTLVLYPYVYVLGRSAFLGQSRQSLEVARTLGLSYGAAVRRVALPLARPALAAGVTLAVMEALADFGAVNLLNYRALTDAIYRVWYGTFDQAAALQLAFVLVSLALTLVVLEQLLRGRARYSQALARGEAVVPRRLRGPLGWLAAAGPLLLLAAVVGAPVAQLLVWAVGSLGDGASATALARAAVNSLLLASVAAVVAVAAATVVAYGPRAHPSRAGTWAARASAIGYAVPGTVVAVAVYVPLAWLDHRIDDVTGAGLLITGSAAGLVLAYVVRFHGLGAVRRPGAAGPDRPLARRGGPQPRGRPHAPARRRPPAAAVARDRHRGAAGLRRGHEGAAGHRAPAPARAATRWRSPSGRRPRTRASRRRRCRRC